ncbi:bile acid:sodium symporter family protein [Amycolatopsis antarctica]|uniref:bile acid:sodium symporter family protein n=1 Tax=Amycolatopsis antarctica TaxID=1854586 RepID=UPI001F0A33F0|nr:bile acid:sodium symporter family protein [Amycolatopsis antarctica]
MVTVFLPLALAVVMFGLGLSLTVADFLAVARSPRAVVIALLCQLVLLPAVCLGLVLVSGLEPVLAVGMMLLAASPGGTMANLFSHLAGGDVALNVSLTAINSLISAATLPVVVNLALDGFLGDGSGIGLQPGKVAQVVAIVLVPVAIGMAVRGRFPARCAALHGPVKVASAVFLVGVIVVALVQEHRTLAEHAATVGVLTVVLCVLSLAVGYWVPRLAGITRERAIASAMEIGIHNSTLAITVAISVLGSYELAVPAAIYGVVMFVPAGICAFAFSRRGLGPTVPARTA